jgi:putative flippase GtrA
LIASSREAVRFGRFAIVGGVGFVIDAGLLAFLHHGAGLDPFLARLVSIVVSALCTWRLNRAVKFGVSQRSQAEEGMRYGAVAALAAGLNYLIYATLLVWPGLPPVVAAVLATLTAMGFSYAGYSRLVFSGAGSSPAPEASSDAIARPSSQSR